MRENGRQRDGRKWNEGRGKGSAPPSQTLDPPPLESSPGSNWSVKSYHSLFSQYLWQSTVLFCTCKTDFEHAMRWAPRRNQPRLDCTVCSQDIYILQPKLRPRPELHLSSAHCTATKLCTTGPKITIPRRLQRATMLTYTPTILHIGDTFTGSRNV